jgi:hypothetical protein
MGTMRATLKGKTKGEVLEEYRRMKREQGGAFLKHHPSSERKASEEMEQDAKTGEWTLRVAFTM